MHAELIAKPSVGIEFISHVGINIPVFARSGVQMNSIIYHESGFEAHIGTKTGQLKFSIPAPKTPTKLFSIRYLIYRERTYILVQDFNRPSFFLLSVFQQ